MRKGVVFVLSLTVLVLLIVLVMAIDTQSTGWKVTTTEKTIDVWSNCKKADKTGGGLDVFAPTKTEAEWDAFILGKPGTVTLSDCLAWSAPVNLGFYVCGGATSGSELSGDCSPEGSTNTYIWFTGLGAAPCAAFVMRFDQFQQTCE